MKTVLMYVASLCMSVGVMVIAHNPNNWWEALGCALIGSAVGLMWRD